MTIKEREAITSKLIIIKRFIRDYKKQEITPTWTIIEEWIASIENLIKYRK